MIQTDERRRLRHAVSLHHGISKPLEKQFRLARKRRPSANKRPESPAKHPVNAPKNPRAFQKRPPFPTPQGRVKPRPPSARIHLAFDSSAQSVQHPRNGDPRRRPHFLYLAK